MKNNRLNLNKIEQISDIDEDFIYEMMPEILDILLIDRTKSNQRYTKNIIWANDNFKHLNTKLYGAKSEIKSELITGKMSDLIKPRSLKTEDQQKLRTKSKAEVFTPTWIVKLQNDEVDKNYIDDDIEKYISRKWLEITCGEAPYITSRYDMTTGKYIELKDRVGFLDRKLQRINDEIEDKISWQKYVEKAYKASYGFEWSGDSLFLARENLLFTYIDYFIDKWNEEPLKEFIKDIAIIISYNLFQMDGLKYIIPLSEKIEIVEEIQLDFLDDNDKEDKKIKIIPGKRVKIMNWETGKMEFFDKGLNHGN
ncbi:MAG: restriction endonuclease subunit M [Helcococcus sp.]|nr:restriction endonuclease subunit M [Helcococcus sp.]